MLLQVATTTGRKKLWGLTVEDSAGCRATGNRINHNSSNNNDNNNNNNEDHRALKPPPDADGEASRKASMDATRMVVLFGVSFRLCYVTSCFIIIVDYRSLHEPLCPVCLAPRACPGHKPVPVGGRGLPIGLSVKSDKA